MKASVMHSSLTAAASASPLSSTTVSEQPGAGGGHVALAKIRVVRELRVERGKPRTTVSDGNYQRRYPWRGPIKPTSNGEDVMPGKHQNALMVKRCPCRRRMTGCTTGRRNEQ